MELNEMEKKLLFQVEGDYQTKILNELYMTVRYSNNSEQREAAEGLTELRGKVRSYEDVIQRNNLWRFFHPHREKAVTRDEAR